jgi:hypothetical protein
MLLDQSACDVRLVVANVAMKCMVSRPQVATVTSQLSKNGLNENIQVTPAKCWQ